MEKPSTSNAAVANRLGATAATLGLIAACVPCCVPVIAPLVTAALAALGLGSIAGVPMTWLAAGLLLLAGVAWMAAWRLRTRSRRCVPAARGQGCGCGGGCA